MSLGMLLYSFGWIGCILPVDGTGGGAAGLAGALQRHAGALRHPGPDRYDGLYHQRHPAADRRFYRGLELRHQDHLLGGGALGGDELLADGAPGGDFLHLERLLAVILGGILAGLGIALCFSQGGSTGGTDIVAMIINRYRTISYGKILIYSDFVIIGSSMLVGYQIDTVIYGYVMTAVVGYTVDMIMAGNQQSSQVFIFTHDYEKMAGAIIESAHRGVTLLDSVGGYSHEKSKVVLVVCRKRETSTILKLAQSVDPEAFISVGSVMGVYGKGFNALNKI